MEPIHLVIIVFKYRLYIPSTAGYYWQNNPNATVLALGGSVSDRTIQIILGTFVEHLAGIQWDLDNRYNPLLKRNHKCRFSFWVSSSGELNQLYTNGDLRLM
jgi:hypothetical protein